MPGAAVWRPAGRQHHGMASGPLTTTEDERDERNDVTMSTHPPAPFCPGCKRFARRMSELDQFINGEGESDVMRAATAEEREEYVRSEEGTYNVVTGHFLCDTCYLNAGMPTGPNGWTCP